MILFSSKVYFTNTKQNIQHNDCLTIGKRFCFILIQMHDIFTQQNMLQRKVNLWYPNTDQTNKINEMILIRKRNLVILHPHQCWLHITHQWSMECYICWISYMPNLLPNPTIFWKVWHLCFLLTNWHKHHLLLLSICIHHSVLVFGCYGKPSGTTV